MEILQKELRIDFLSRRRIAAMASAVVIAAGIVSLVSQGINWGLDFTGGTLVEIRFDEPVSVEEVRSELESTGVDGVIVQYFGTSRDIMIRVPTDSEIANASQLSAEMIRVLRIPYGEELAESLAGGLQLCEKSDGSVSECQLQMRRVEFVGPKVGQELTEKGGLAMIYALLGILIYVAWRFEWRFAVGSVVALVHDVVVTVGLFSVFQIEFSLAVLAAVLAVIGYSLNDTIVVFDRIRENFRKKRHGDPKEVMNRSINQTLRRTILTSFTTLLVVVTLLIFGGEVIRGFSFALLIGVLVGTYSSIFIASPVVLGLGISHQDMAAPQET